VRRPRTLALATIASGPSGAAIAAMVPVPSPEVAAGVGAANAGAADPASAIVASARVRGRRTASLSHGGVDPYPVKTVRMAR